MSGTSLDGIDASLVRTDGDSTCELLATYHLPYSTDFQCKLKSLIASRNNWFEVEIELTLLHAQTVQNLLNEYQIDSSLVDVIGFHGQTIYHAPEKGICWQIGNAHILAQQTNINVVSDFRRRDIASGGNGAPLVPIFHQCLMRDEEKPVAILNIGGVSNITYLCDNNLAYNMLAFDTGPGNAMINDAMIRHYNKEYDDEGNVAKVGNIEESVVNSILQDEYFATKPPKSLDRNYFNKYLNLFESKKMKPTDIIATLTEVTIASIINSLKYLDPIAKKVFVCGGGVKNKIIMKELAIRALDSKFQTINKIGLDADFIEAQAFAYLAVRYIKNLPSSFTHTTSVNREKLSGVLFRV